MQYELIGTFKEIADSQEEMIQEESCYVLGTTIAKDELSTYSVIEGYKNQNASVERGFRFLKDPMLFAPSLFVKKKESVMGLLMVVTLALLVYSIAQRRLRRLLKEVEESLPNQSGQKTSKPTLR